ncbi:hypothetical protein [Luteipulveratus flavus]|uniref:Uncharacterized protein n=1 Tax=Luteipulveratus flavus TaxID=3031728 RepID=A0ABT6C3C3_9MICO|nr:hypothetical protein [Luteipulveratus sp. YIM 133296]MDF8263288.1 hypothetical protein [Luteipulveratus sp. YIM 133296]
MTRGGVVVRAGGHRAPPGSVESVPVALLVQRLGRLSDDRMREMCAALAVATACG